MKSIELKPVKNDEEYDAMLEWIDHQFDKKPDLESREGNNLQIALQLIKAYEDVSHRILSTNRHF